MCMSDSPAIPAAAAPPPPPQEEKSPNKAPEMAEARRKKGNANTTIEGGTLLTGPTGIANSSLTTGGGSLLGG